MEPACWSSPILVSPQTVQEDVESYYEAYIWMGTMFDESDLKVKHIDLKL